MSENDQMPSPIPQESRPTLELNRIEDHDFHEVHVQARREKDAPKEGISPIPLILIFGALVFWGGIYLTRYSSGFDPMIYDESIHPADRAEKPEAVFDPIAAGQRLYKNNCAVCHQPTGQGLPGAFPTLHETEWVLGTDERVIALVLRGMSGKLNVAGYEYNSVMTGFSHIKDREIAAVLTYVRTNAEWGNSASPVSEEKVTEVRARYGNNATAWTVDEILAEFPFQE